MDGGLPLTNPMFWMSLLLGGIVLAAISYGFQMAQDESNENQTLNVKGIIRDMLLGGIFTAMGWTLLPDAMTNITSGASSLLTTASSIASVKTSGGGSGGSGGSNGPDVQVGPPRF